jgi:tRNA (guanine37-N1)-methyltransferase
MRFDVFSLLPDVMAPYLRASILGRAQAEGLVEVHLHDIRDYAEDRHRTTDDVPYGGGGGMVMKPEPIFAAVEDVLGGALGSMPVVLLSPQGRLLNQDKAAAMAKQPRIALIAGRYEGVDERVRQHLATEEISVGDFVLTGGELPALILIDAVARWIPGVLGDPSAAGDDSYAVGLLEHPHYTRPAEFRGWPVPEILRSGDHAAIARWRRQQSLLRTLDRRPDLFNSATLSDEDRAFLAEAGRDTDIDADSVEKGEGG